MSNMDISVRGGYGGLPMNVSLTAEQRKFIENELRSGRYHTAAEVIREGLRLLMDRERDSQRRLELLREEIQKGLDAAGRGELLDGERVFAELRAKLRGRAAD